jgi:hypothetical protein
VRQWAAVLLIADRWKFPTQIPCYFLFYQGNDQGFG